jgi:hypothetical protein
LPRTDFWLTGEDIEFSLRLTTQFNGVFVPTASCRHLPPDGGDAARGHAQHYLKFAAMIQNSAFLATRLPHTRTLWKYQPSNWWRFFRTFGYTPGAFVDVLKAVWRGGVRGRTVGMAGFTEFRDRYYQIP